MKRAALVLIGAATLLVASCSGEGTDSPTRVELAAAPGTLFAGELVTVTVTAHNNQFVIKTVSIDFTDDGTMDESQTFNSNGVSATFASVYAAPGTYDVRAAVADEKGTVTSKSMEVTVMATPTTVPVAALIDGISVQDGRCYAADPPATCVGCTRLVGTETRIPVRVSLGEQPHGATVKVAQSFNQWPVVFGRQLYACDFTVHVVSGTAGHEKPIGIGTCGTSSLVQPAVLKCRVEVSGVVP